ncbi:MAG: SDR family oxidoreductase, partial [Deltaproteobacteria bacterium]|nr:SDR family oxidoreductase [Deltaproteobacteria bacterium]
AASGMGLATARFFAQNGWFIGICDVNEQGLESLESEIGAENCHTAVLDVSDRAAYQKVLNAFGEKTEGRLDVLFNNAGIIMPGTLFGDTDFADIERMIQVNLMGVLNGIHSAYPMLKKTPNSLCFSTSSSSAILGSKGLATYSATKHAIKGLTEALSIEFSIVDIRAADTLPGHIMTGMVPEEFKDYFPTEGMWRLIPAEAVAEIVWAAYHDKSGKLHWYVPDDLLDLVKSVGKNIEAERNIRIENFQSEVKRRISQNKKD